MANRYERQYPHDFCPLDGCYRQRSNARYCERHQRQLMRTGSPYSTQRDWVSDAAGPDCLICGRSVYEHGVTEWCVRELVEAAA